MQKNKDQILALYYLDNEKRIFREFFLVNNILVKHIIDTEAAEQKSPIPGNSIQVVGWYEAYYIDNPKEFIELAMKEDFKIPNFSSIIYQFLQVERVEKAPGAAPILYYTHSMLRRGSDNKLLRVGNISIKDPEKNQYILDDEEGLNSILEIIDELEPRKAEIKEKILAKKVDGDTMNFIYNLALDAALTTFKVFENVNNSEIATEVIKNRPFIQENYRALTDLTYMLSKTVRLPFTHNYTDMEMEKAKEGKLKLKIGVGRKGNVDLVNELVLQTENRLEFFDKLILETIYTHFRENPDCKAFTFLDLANTLVKTKSGKPLNGKDKFIEDVARSVRRLMTTLVSLDFTEEGKVNKNIAEYLEAGGSGKIEFPFLSGTIRPIKKPNGKVLDGIVLNKRVEDTLFFRYVDRVNQIRTLSGEVLKMPLKTGKENVSLHNYILTRLATMPYDNTGKFKNKKKPRFLNAKIEFLKKLDQPEMNKTKVRALPDYKDLKKIQNSLPAGDTTINVDELIKDLKLKTRRSRIYLAIEKELSYLKEKGYIEDFTANEDKTKQTKSYTIRFF